MRNKKYSNRWMLLLCISLFAFGSCNDWLDVKPKSQMKDSELFSSESGFKEALSGVYSIMSREYLYSKQLTFGMLGAMGQEWTFRSNVYDQIANYTYSDDNATKRIDSVWNGMYNAVANTNKLLAEIDGQRSLFSGVNYEVIKGEALALRAFLHFDLLRLFGASYADNPDKIAIPYVTRYSVSVYPQLKVSAVIDSVLTDLRTAASYLERDPIYTGQAITSAEDNGYLMNRQVHLNYYAVKGLMARVYLYKKDYANARTCAQEVINSNKFPWVEQANLLTSDLADLTFASEHLFALNVVRLSTIVENNFTRTAGNNSFYINSARRLEYYGDATDWRFLYQFEVDVNGTSIYLRKYHQLTNSNWDPYYRNKMPMIKLSEMYLILSECNFYSGGDALAPLNTLHAHRGIGAVTTAPADYPRWMVSAYRNEFIGEGQLFYYYKRILSGRIEYYSEDLSSKAYILPMPVSEFDTPNRVNNR